MKSAMGSGSFAFQIVPAQPVPPNDKIAQQDLIEKKLHDKSAALLTQVSQLFVGATTMFSSLAKEAAQASQRIGQLQGRIDQLRLQVPRVEQLCGSGEDFSRNARADFKGDRTEKSQLFQVETMSESVLKRHMANPPAPDLAPLDRFRSDGKPCLMFYTYPQFFLDEWIREQNKEMEERKLRNAERRAEKEKARHQPGSSTTTASVKQVMKRVYDVDTGQLITVAAGEGAGGGVERRAPTAAGNVAPKQQTYVAQTFPPPPAGSRPPPNSAVAASFPPPPPISSAAKNVAAARPAVLAPPPQAMAPPTAAQRVSPRPSAQPAPPSQPYQQQQQPPQMQQPHFSAPPPPPQFGGGGYAPPAPAPPAAPAFVPPPAPAGPPPPAAPPPPPQGSLAAQLEAVKEKTAAPSGGGGLLESIKAGVALRKAAAPVEDKPVVDSFSGGGFNVAAILARRAALEMSDEESNSGDWD